MSDKINRKKSKALSLRSKKDWENIFHSIPDIITVHDTNFNIIYANKEAEKILSLPRGKKAQAKCHKYFHGLNAPPDKCCDRECIRTGKPVFIETFEPHLNRFIEIRAMPVFENAQVTGLIHIVRDITERKRIEEELLRQRKELAAIVKDRTTELTSVIELLQDEIIERRNTENALRESENRYRELFNYMSSGVAVLESVDDGKDFIFKDFNHAGEQIDKISKKALLGKRVTEIFPGIKEMGLFSVYQRVWKTGIPEYLPVTEYRDERISGWRENYVYKLPSGEIIAVYDDVTERKQLEERESGLLRELKTIFENFPVGILYLDTSFRIISSNRFFNEFTGFREEELKGQYCYDVVGEYANDLTKKGMDKICTFCKKVECYEHKKPVVIERPFKDKFIRVTTIPETDENGEVSRFMEIVEDITERKRAEAEAIRASHLAALGELAAGVAHEINNPINGIINYAQILASKSKQETREYDIAKRIIKESDRIAGIVNNLLSFARNSKEGKIPSSIINILSDSLALTETHMKKEGIKFILNVPPTLPAIEAQPQQIEQVFLNLISNARYALNLKYRGEHENKILEISAKKISANKRSYIRITFHDRGTGIPDNIMDKIMNPFFTTKPSSISTGLGLSISHGIISDHGGRLRIESVEGEFTRVIVELPVMRRK